MLGSLVSPSSRQVFRVASVLLFLAAFTLFVLAFTRFDGGAGPPPGSPGYDEYERQGMRDAQLSVIIGLAGCFVLLGAFASFSKAKAIRPAGEGADGPPPGLRP